MIEDGDATRFRKMTVGKTTLLTLSVWIYAAAAFSAPLAPNDASIAADLRVWLRTPGVDYDASAGVWADSSGRGNDAAVPPGSPHGYASASFTKPTRVTGQSGAIFSNRFSVVAYETSAASGVFELLCAPDINGGSGFGDLTIIAVYKCATHGSGARPVGIGSYAADGVGGGSTGADNYNLACDPSIRKDNGSLGAGSYTGSNTTPGGYFIRSSRMTSSSQALDEWFYVDAADGFEHVLHLDTGAFTTRLDAFYLGTLWTQAGSSSSDTAGNIAEVLVYNAALTDQQIEDVNAWLRENLGVPLSDPMLVTNALAPAELGATNVVAENDYGGSGATYAGSYRVSSSNVAGQTFSPTGSVLLSDVTFQLGNDSESSPFTAGDTLSLQIYSGTNLAPAHAMGPAVTRSLEGLFLLDKAYVTFELSPNESDAVGLLRGSQVYTLALSSTTTNGIFISHSVPPDENGDGSDEPSGQGFEGGAVLAATRLQDTEFVVQGTASPGPETPTNRPNFLFILADDQAPETMGAYGNTVCQTPNLDRLAAEGMLFQGAHHMGSWSGAVCTPSRTMIMCGRTVWRIPGRPSGGGPVPGDMPNHTLPAVFNAAGYDTFRTCKTGNSYEAANSLFTVRRDSTKREGTDAGGSAWHAEQVLDYLQTRIDTGDTDPFLIYYGFSHPHDPRHGKPELLAKYGAIDPGPPSTPNPAAPPLQVNYLPEHPFFHGHVNLRDEVAVEGVGTNRDEATVRNELGKEYACIENIDNQVGRVLDKLRDMGELDHTYVFYTADHGIAVGRHGLMGKQNLYEHTWRVPFIVRGPGIAPGTETGDYIYLLDMLPTLCDLAGIPIPSTVDGISFRPTLEGRATHARDAVYGVYSGGTKPGMRSVKRGRWKLIKYDVMNNAVQETQLFDLATNPHEFLAEHAALGLVATKPYQVNLARYPAYALIRQELEELMMEQRRDLQDPYQFLGDRTLLRFEEGPAGQPADTVADRMPWGNAGTAKSGNGGDPPVYATDVPSATDFVVGEANTLSLDFERDNLDYVEIPDSRELGFGNEPFTIEAWVKLESLPTGADVRSRAPLAMKKVIGEGDAALDYMFLAAAGSYGNSNTYNRMALKLGDPTVISSLSIPDTNWHYVSVALDPVADIVRFTLDDQVDTKATAVTGTENDGPLVIGVHFDSSGSIDSAFDGLIDEFSVTDGCLALEELQPLAGAPSPGPFRIRRVLLNPAGGVLEATFDSAEGLLYDLQVSPSLTPPAWTTVASFVGGITGASETTLEMPFPYGDAQRAFTRVRCRGPARP